MDRRVHIIDRREIFNRFIFRIDELQLQHERFDGSMSPRLTRLVLNRGDSVAVLLHDPALRKVVLCEQFRPPTLKYGPGWLLELPAGMLEPGERVEDCARREVEEETGYSSPTTLGQICTVYPSPGGSSERIHICHAEIAIRDDVPAFAGNAGEGEDVRLVTLHTDDVIAMARQRQILDAKTFIACQWLDLFTHAPDA